MKPIGKKSIQQGFTLIELMIVIAIIAILAAIAIPQYENYITRSQATEAQTVTSALENTVQMDYMQNGSCPLTLGSGGLATNWASYSGKYVASATVTAGAAGGATGPTGATATCNIAVLFKSGSVSTPLQGKTISFSGYNSGGSFQWVCNSQDVAAKYLPSSCRG